VFGGPVLLLFERLFQKAQSESCAMVNAVSDKLKILGKSITFLSALTTAVTSGSNMKLLKPDGS